MAQFLDVHERTVRGWYTAWLAGGDEALAAKAYPAGRSRLTSEQEAQVLSWLERSPTEAEFGFATELWTAARVAELIRKRFGVVYHSRYLSRWLKQRGVTPQMVRRRPRGHNPEAMAAWAEQDWLRILKKRTRPALTSSRSTRRA